jgi:hypothetical protein
MPVMELPKTLENLLGCLLAENGLLSWQIFEERSSHIVVKIRFGNGHCGPTTENQSTETVTTYRRKPPSQVKRDHARLAAHKRKQSTAPGIQTRSMAAACLPTEPRDEKQKAHNSEHASCEHPRYDDPKREHCLDPLVLPFESPRNAPDASLLSKGNYSESTCDDDVFSKSYILSISSCDVPIAVVIPPVLPSTVNDPQPPEDEHSFVASDDDHVIVGLGECVNSPNMVSSESENSDDNISIPEMCPDGMESLLEALRTEIRSIIRPPHQ